MVIIIYLILIQTGHTEYREARATRISLNENKRSKFKWLGRKRPEKGSSRCHKLQALFIGVAGARAHPSPVVLEFIVP